MGHSEHRPAGRIPRRTVLGRDIHLPALAIPEPELAGLPADSRPRLPPRRKVALGAVVTLLSALAVVLAFAPRAPSGPPPEKTVLATISPPPATPLAVAAPAPSAVAAPTRRGAVRPRPPGLRTARARSSHAQPPARIDLDGPLPPSF